MGRKRMFIIIMLYFQAITLILCGCGSSKNQSDKPVETGKEDHEENNREDVLEPSAVDSSQMSDENMAETHESGQTELFVTGKGEREGFIVAEEALVDVPEGYVGIYSLDDLQKVTEDIDGNYILMSDLDFSGAIWKKSDFKGMLDGNYHVISNLSSCLLGKLSGTVQNLGLENVNVSDAALADQMISGTISNCYVTGSVQGRGGLVGSIVPPEQTFINIQYCYNNADVISDAASNEGGAGGLAGDVYLGSQSAALGSVYIYNCENYGNITGEGYLEGGVGGLIGSVHNRYGDLQYQVLLTINRCFNYGEVSTSDSSDYSVGGIVGRIGSRDEVKASSKNYIIRQCANYNNVTGNKLAGAICGEVDFITFSGQNKILTMRIEDCLNTAEVILSGDNSGGGVCGGIELNYGTCKIRNCLNIGNEELEYYTRPQINDSTPFYDCTGYYCIGQIPVEVMKDIRENLPDFSYPSAWGINELYGGFPHPYGVDEAERVMAYYDDVLDNMAASMDEKDIVLMQRYTDMLAAFSLGGYWPEDTEKEYYSPNTKEYDGETFYEYAIVDIDKDGQEELLIKGPDFIEVFVYSYDLDKNEVIKEAEIEYMDDWKKENDFSGDIQWRALMARNYSVYTGVYLRYYHDMLKRDMDLDIGEVFMEMEGVYGMELMDGLASGCGIDFKEVEEGYVYEGSYDDIPAFTFYMDNSGILYYENQQAGNMTLLGLYPGMKEKEAEETLKKYGFVRVNDYSFATGDAPGNYRIGYGSEGGEITSICIYEGNAYTG